ncbi:MAG: 50S ribosomal protein L4 [Candidatus Moranbacteria bacterium RIFOXYB1_FULL_43_19]|nr:MAG: 50S ribosomal protein L4 [Candidatus Moranbacteria bacterium RIFOXYB1_FULL_43_19]OGI28126.1 MAG: 50S ribosomal protein L4 [Candidatus Moranbacteria bacterium RIFOXYA1_FULL_44_7]OGI34160.1 MAG: 50S ribosomal protein L4 [Candidatus Moranbacteria bacterium RIFOXYC1_FULL_44_13]OGI38347.1 MAG: 50S ribosomal protein L4 [Candidatus Moranbacteria bacterium RIFOXYD1_FULL_44_12]
MIKFPVYNLEGKKIKDIDLSEDVFGAEANDALLHQIYVAQYANRRQVLAHTKDRAERAGSGKKPWRQKGTGRARVGSVRSPIWKKGGVIFGPTKGRNFKKDFPKKMSQRAIGVALSGKLADKEIVIVDSLKMKEAKTKAMSKSLEALKMKGSILIAFSKNEKNSKRASQNIQRVDNIDVENLNVFDILNHKYLAVSEEGVKIIEGKYKK